VFRASTCWLHRMPFSHSPHLPVEAVLRPCSPPALFRSLRPNAPNAPKILGKSVSLMANFERRSPCSKPSKNCRPETRVRTLPAANNTSSWQAASSVRPVMCYCPNDPANASVPGSWRHSGFCLQRGPPHGSTGYCSRQTRSKKTVVPTKH
jgi:hypothetical protein